MSTPEILLRIEEVTGVAPRRSGAGWSCLCPSHDDRSPSLSVTETDEGRTLLHCHAGCPADVVVHALGLAMNDLFPKTGATVRLAPSTPTRERPAAVPSKSVRAPSGYVFDEAYDYTRADGTLLYLKARFKEAVGGDSSKKTFRIYQPGTRPGEVVLGLSGVNERPLYRLPEVAEQIHKDTTVMVVEGEKDVDRLWQDTPYAATCNDGGAGKWRPEHTEALASADVVVVADNDAPGVAHAEAVCRALLDRARSVRLLQLDTLPDGTPMPEGGDVSDWLDAAASMDGFDGPTTLGLLVDAAPAYAETPGAADANAASSDAAPEVGEIRPIPPGTYRKLPGLIADACLAYERPVQRAAFLVSVLVVLSAMLPGVVVRYGREVLSVHLYGFLIGGTASGKGVVKTAGGWTRGVDARLTRESHQERKAWRDKRDERERLRKSRSAKDTARYESLEAVDPLGEEPTERFLVMGEDTTAAGLADAIHDNPAGVLLASTEADTVADANGRQHGQFSAVLRKGFHNEPHAESRRNADRLLIPEVRLALLLAGTPDQVRSMFEKGIEDGLYSRFALAELEPTRYESQREASEDDAFTRVMELGEKAASEIYWTLRKRRHPLRVVLPTPWWKRMDEAYMRLDGDLWDRGQEELTSIAKRGPVIVYRIAAVLAVWRAYVDGVDLSTVAGLEVGDDDAEAALVLALTLSETSVRIAAEFGRQVNGVTSQAHEVAEEALAVDAAVFKSLPDAFEGRDVVSAYGAAGKSRATAYRRLEMWLSDGVVDANDQGPGRVYRKATPLPDATSASAI